MATRSASYVLGLIAFGAFSAAADPLVDDLAAMRETGPAEPMKRKRNAWSLTSTRWLQTRASRKPPSSDAPTWCPNQPLRDLRNRKYAGTAAFKEGYQYVTLGYPSRGEQGREILCLSAVSGDSWLAKK